MNLKQSVRRGAAVMLPVVAGLILAACSSSAAEPDATATPTTTETQPPSVVATPTESEGAIRVTDAWARATPGLSGENSAAYMLITNHGKGDRLVGAAVSEALADRAELHETVRDGDQMKMQQVEGWDVPGDGGTLELKQGANHVMLLELAGQLVPGATIEVTLQFEQAGEVQLEVPVREGAAMGGGMHR